MAAARPLGQGDARRYLIDLAVLLAAGRADRKAAIVWTAARLAEEIARPLGPHLRASARHLPTAGLRLRSARIRSRPFAVVLALVIGLTAIVPAAAGAVGSIPDPRLLASADIPYSTFVYDRDGRLLSVFEQERREHVTLDEVPLLLQQATIAIEDRTFWTNTGVEPLAILRALLANQEQGQVVQGGSTITQQLVKALIVGDDRTIERKVREAAAAIRVTLEYPKERILEMYLDQVYYGNRSYGVKAAAKTYFGTTDLHTLTLGQAALLAGLPQRPSVYDPVANPDGARARRVDVLAAMAEAGYITRAQAALAAEEPIVVRSIETPLALPHVVYRVRDELAQLLGSERAVAVGGYRVWTTIDPQLQTIAEKHVRDRVAALRGSNVHNAALIALDPRTGQVLAYVGSVDHEGQDPRVRGQFDVAGLGERQVGSTMKLFTYLTALRLGYTPSSVLWDVSTNFATAGGPEYRPQNAAPSGSGAGPENGPMTIRQAIRESLNIPAVKIAALVGVDEIVRTARMLGVEREWPADRLGLSFAIGSGEMTLRELAGAYQVVANGGVRLAPSLIARVEDREGNVVYDAAGRRGTQVISPQLAWLMTDLLKDTTDPKASRIFGPWTTIGRPAALKTGTTDDLRDVLAVGYVPQLLTAVWMGNSDNSPMRGISSAMGPGVLWREFMKEAIGHLGLAEEWYPRPDGIVDRTVCVRPGLTGGVGSGLLPSSECPSSWRTAERYVAGTEPKTSDAAFFGGRCVNATAERPQWQSDLVRWARSGKASRLGMPMCGVSSTSDGGSSDSGSRRGRGKRDR